MVFSWSTRLVYIRVKKNSQKIFFRKMWIFIFEYPFYGKSYKKNFTSWSIFLTSFTKICKMIENKKMKIKLKKIDHIWLGFGKLIFTRNNEQLNTMRIYFWSSFSEASQCVTIYGFVLKIFCQCFLVDYF